jgi:hypothetical protein
MVMRIRAPFDSTSPVQANANTCPIGFPTPSPALLSWDAVQGAQSYTITVLHRTCEHQTVSSDQLIETDTSASIPIGAPDEDYALIQIQCPGSVSTNLCFMPYVTHLDGSVQTIVLRVGDDLPGQRGVHHADGYFLPAVASAPGVAPTYWTSAVTVTNLLDLGSTARMLFTPSGSDGATDYLETEVQLPARSSVTWDNVLQSLFGADAVGSLEIRGTGLVVASRTSTPAAIGGSYGQGIPAVGPEQVLSIAGEPAATVGSVSEGARFRSNLGLCETWGETATVEVVVADESGTPLGTRALTLRPYESTQINRVVRNVTGETQLENAIVTVTVVSGGGRVAAYLSTVDNATGDPTYLAVAPSRPTGG